MSSLVSGRSDRYEPISHSLVATTTSEDRLTAEGDTQVLITYAGTLIAYDPNYEPRQEIGLLETEEWEGTGVAGWEGTGVSGRLLGGEIISSKGARRLIKLKLAKRRRALWGREKSEGQTGSVWQQVSPFAKTNGIGAENIPLLTDCLEQKKAPV